MRLCAFAIEGLAVYAAVVDGDLGGALTISAFAFGVSFAADTVSRTERLRAEARSPKPEAPRIGEGFDGGEP